MFCDIFYRLNSISTLMSALSRMQNELVSDQTKNENYKQVLGHNEIEQVKSYARKNKVEK
jgi:hypothetical protein